MFEEKPGMTTAIGAVGDDTFVISYGGDGDNFEGSIGEDVFIITGEINPITLKDFGRFGGDLPFGMN